MEGYFYVIKGDGPGDVQNTMTPAVMRIHADATKNGPAAPVNRSANRSMDLKHWKTMREQQDIDVDDGLA